MTINRLLVVFGAICLSLPGEARACGDPTEKWYSDVSDVVFDGFARCKPENRTCQIRIDRVLKDSEDLSFQHRVIEVDYQNWFADWYKANPDEIIITCGVPVFEPEQINFRARFYANLDEKTSELVVRHYRLKGNDPYGQE